MKRTLARMLLIFLASGIILSSAGLYQHPHESIAYAQRPAPDDTESNLPSVTITSPSYCSGLLVTGDLTIRGTAHDEESGIEKVEVFVHSLAFNNEFLFELAEPASAGNWSQWSYNAFIPDTDNTYRILVQATDGAGNTNWDETFVNLESVRELHQARQSLDSGSEGQTLDRVALVTPTFTSAAYNYDSFYFFYYRYASVSEGVDITEDLNLMTGEIPLESEDAAIFESFANKIRAFSPESTVSIIRDENVHHGLIFSEDGRNAFDALVLFHNEYVTQEEYDNLRTFVRNGGEIIFMDTNIFYAEVTFDESSCMVTLVAGHNWEFDGKAVRKGVWERYAEENREWMGSNFINRDISNPVRFDNNPFSYTHFEENQLLNPNANILIDYGAKFRVEPTNNPFVPGGIMKPEEYLDLGMRVATYELEYGDGKVIMLGIYGQNLVNNTSFMDFFDKIVLTRILGNHHNVEIEGENFELYSKLEDGKVINISLDKASKSVSLELDMNENASENDRMLIITLPKKLIDADNPQTDSADFTVFLNGREVEYSQTYDDVERALAIPISGNVKEVKVFGTQVIPEFPSGIAILGLLSAFPILICILASRIRSREDII